MLEKLLKGQKKRYTWKTREIVKLQLLWYLSLVLISLTQKYNFPNIPERLNAFAHYSFGITIKLLLMAYLFYILLFNHNLSLSRIKLSFKNNLTDLKMGIKISYPFSLLTILLINLQHQNLGSHQLFQPLIKITSFKELITSLFYLLLLNLLTLIPALLIELFYRVIVYEFFKERLGIFLGALISSLYYSLALLKLNFGFLIAHFLIGIISICLYERHDSLISAVIWQSFYQSTIILYVFGFQIF